MPDTYEADQWREFVEAELTRLSEARSDIATAKRELAEKTARHLRACGYRTVSVEDNSVTIEWSSGLWVRQSITLL